MRTREGEGEEGRIGEERVVKGASRGDKKGVEIGKEESKVGMCGGKRRERQREGVERRD